MSAIAFACTLAVRRWVLEQSLTPFLNSFCIVGAVLLVLPTAWVGRKLLDSRPTTERAAVLVAPKTAGLTRLPLPPPIRLLCSGDAPWRSSMSAGRSAPVSRSCRRIRPSRCRMAAWDIRRPCCCACEPRRPPQCQGRGHGRGAGLVLGGDSDPTYAQILARGDSTFLKLSNQNGHVHLVKP
jgi:hypothetical protein